MSYWNDGPDPLYILPNTTNSFLVSSFGNARQPSFFVLPVLASNAQDLSFGLQATLMFPLGTQKLHNSRSGYGAAFFVQKKLAPNQYIRPRLDWVKAQQQTRATGQYGSADLIVRYRDKRDIEHQFLGADYGVYPSSNHSAFNL